MPGRNGCSQEGFDPRMPCGPRRRWGRRMRIVEPMLLLLLREEPLHGYLLVERLFERFGIEGLPPQTVYRALQDMEALAWVTGDWDLAGVQGPPRRVYAISAEGRVALSAWSDEIETLRTMLDSFLVQYEKIHQQNSEEISRDENSRECS